MRRLPVQSESTSGGSTVEIGFAAVGIDADHVLAAVGEAQLVEAGAASIGRSARWSLPSAKAAGGLGSITSTPTACSLAVRNSMKRIHQRANRCGARCRKDRARSARRTARNRMQREIVGQIVEARCEKQDAALADFLFEQQRRLIGKPGDHARAGVDPLAPHNKISLRTIVRPLRWPDRRDPCRPPSRSCRHRVNSMRACRMFAPKTGMRGRRAAKCPAAIRTLPPARTYLASRFQTTRAAKPRRKERRTHISTD